MLTKAKFLDLIRAYGLPPEMFEILERKYKGEIMLTIRVSNGDVLESSQVCGLVFQEVYNTPTGLMLRSKIDVDKYFGALARQYENEQKIVKLSEENAKLRRKIEKYRLSPGGKDYEAAKRHFNAAAQSLQ